MSVGDDAAWLEGDGGDSVHSNEQTAGSAREEHRGRRQATAAGGENQQQRRAASSGAEQRSARQQQTQHDGIAIAVTSTRRDNTNAHTLTVRPDLLLTTPARSCA